MFICKVNILPVGSVSIHLDMLYIYIKLHIQGENNAKKEKQTYRINQ